MLISFIIPAHNEQALLPATLEALLDAARSLNETFEVIVVDDASTDRTADVAREAGAKVASVNLRQIGAVRNAGARASSGEVLFFIDADTLVYAPTLRAALDEIKGGAVGGGALPRLDEHAPRWGRVMTWIILKGMSRRRLAAGCFVFARRDAFERIGGFDETYFIGEELYITQALKRQGRFVLVKPPVVTSARKFRTYSFSEMLRAICYLGLRGPRAWRSRESTPWWYDARRDPTPVKPQA